MWIPREWKYFRIAALGHAFIAYRTVNPYALGNARHLLAASCNFSNEYAYTGLPARSMHALADSAVKNADVVGGASVRSTVAAREVVVVVVVRRMVGDDDDNGVNAPHDEVSIETAAATRVTVIRILDLNWLFVC